MSIKKRVERLEAIAGSPANEPQPLKLTIDWEAAKAKARSFLSPEELEEALLLDEIFKEVLERTPMPPPAEGYVSEWVKRRAEAETMLEKELGRKLLRPMRRHDSCSPP